MEPHIQTVFVRLHSLRLVVMVLYTFLLCTMSLSIMWAQDEAGAFWYKIVFWYLNNFLYVDNGYAFFPLLNLKSTRLQININDEWAIWSNHCRLHFPLFIVNVQCAQAQMNSLCVHNRIGCNVLSMCLCDFSTFNSFCFGFLFESKFAHNFIGFSQTTQKQFFSLSVTAFWILKFVWLIPSSSSYKWKIRIDFISSFCTIAWICLIAGVSIIWNLNLFEEAPNHNSWCGFMNNEWMMHLFSIVSNRYSTSVWIFYTTFYEWVGNNGPTETGI